MTEVLVVCGVGGAGKTTSSVVLALAHAASGKRVALLTIDPARRLADAIGLAHLGNAPVRVPVDLRGSVDALMLDRRAAWEELVRAQAPDGEIAERLLANPYFRAVSERLSGGHEYMANEKLHQLATSGRWDLVVVDTPPSRHALDFLRASDRIQRLLDERLLGALLRPSTGIVGLATRGIADAVRRLAGDAMLQDLRDFFELVAGLADGLRARAEAVSRLVRSPACRFVLTLSARAPQTEEVKSFLSTLGDEHIRFEGFVINRWIAPSDTTADDASPPAPAGVTAEVWADALTRLRAARRDRIDRGAADAALAADLLRYHRGGVWKIPDSPAGTADLAGLSELARALEPAHAGAPLP